MPAPGAHTGRRQAADVTGGRVVLRDKDGNVADVEDRDATAAELDERARAHMAWLRAGVLTPGPARTTIPCSASPAPDGRRSVYDPGATAVIPTVRPRP